MKQIWLAALGACWAGSTAQAAPVDFAAQVEPLLAKHCHECHGPSKRKGGLRLDKKDAALHSAIVPGQSAKSEIVRRLTTADTDDRMPPEKPPLPPADIALLRRWIDEGAAWPEAKGGPHADGLDDLVSPEEKAFWSFRPLADLPPPEIVGDTWSRTAVDPFVLQAMRAEGLDPAPAADRRTLIRRVTFDLSGLAPTPAEVDAFVGDRAPDAYEKLVERLLASPRYGERWAQHWLDVVRYAETEGFEYDNAVPDLWRYRDYVIQAFNQDLAYDRFVTEQIAGDEGMPGNARLQIAAGFHRLGPVRRNAGNQEITSSRNEVLTERTDIVGAAFLGLTMGCARCHDHKFDPIRQTDYYRLQAYLAATQSEDVPTSGSKEAYAVWKAETDDIYKEVKRLEKMVLGKKGEEEAKLHAAIKETEARLRPPPPVIATVVNGDETPVHLLKRGDPDRKGPRMGMSGPAVLQWDGRVQALPPGSPQPRTALARWLVDRRHPLTARVMVNRLWQHHFGVGIVPSTNDFGANGIRPTHPELLDHLAFRLVQGGWRLKPLHRLMVLSSTYRQASRSPAMEARARDKDPKNRFLWKYSRRRLDGEEIRDAMLQAAGALNPKMGGPSVIVPVDEALVGQLYKPSQWAVTPDRAEHGRRSVYLLGKRNLRNPFMEVFDQPNAQTSCARRESSTHAPQALELLNGATANELAAVFAARLRREAGKRPAAQVDHAFRLATGRPPTSEEKRLAAAFLSTQPLEEYALAMFNLNAFLYVD